MRRIAFILFALCLLATNSKAQDIYKEVVRLKSKAEALTNDTTQNIEARKIACFKNDALYYLMDKAANEDNFSEIELGKQANAMIEFVNTFVKRLSQEKKKKDKDIILATYKNATTSNSLFLDPEKDITYGYVDNEKFITQFSLDTDWVKALAQVKK